MKTFNRLAFLAFALASFFSVAHAEDSEVLLELRRINESLGRIERLLSQTSFDGGKSVGLTPAPEAAPAEAGCRVKYHRMEEFNTIAYSLPQGEPDVEQRFEGSRFSPNEVRQKFGYPEDTYGIVVWEGDFRFPGENLEFQFGWGLQVSRYHTGLGSVTLRSLSDGQALELQNLVDLEKPHLLTVVLAEGLYRLQFVAPTHTIGFSPEGGGQQPNYLVLQYREAGSGGAWITVTPSMLMMPAS